MNAAVWFGAAVAFTVAVLPAFLAADMQKMLGEIYSGIAAQIVFERYLALHYWCGAVALVHQLAEWIYLGKALQRFTLGLIVALFSLGLVSGLWLQPKVKKLHQIKYARPTLYTPSQQAQAAREYGFWRGVSQIINLLVLGGLTFYAWRTVHTGDSPRFVPTGKFRS